MENNESTIEELSVLLWELVSDKVEEVEEIRKMLKNIGYVEDLEDILSSMNHSEIVDSDFFNILEKNIKDSEAVVKFEMPYILNTYNDEVSLRVTGFVEGECIIFTHKIPDLEMLKFSEMNRQELLEYKPFVGFENMDYLNCECDDLRAV